MEPGGTLKFCVDTNQDRDFNFYQCGIASLDSIYWVPQEIYNNFKNTSAKKFSFLHLNIRSLTKNFVAFEEFYKNFKFWVQQSMFVRSFNKLHGYLQRFFFSVGWVYRCSSNQNHQIIKRRGEVSYICKKFTQF